MLNLTSSLRYATNGKKRKTNSLRKAKKPNISFQPLEPSTKYRRDTIDYASAPLTSNPESCAKKDSMKYTGTLVKGIATMHKSNAVPVIDDEQAKDLARMRR